MDILGAIDASINLANKLYKLVNNFQDGPENARGHLLDSQLSNIRLDLVRTIVQQTEFSNLNYDQRYRIAEAVRDLWEDLSKAIAYVKARAPTDFVARVQWAVWHDSGATKLFNNIETRFSVLQSLLDLARQHPNLASLDKDHFTIINDYSEYKHITCALGSSYCVEADLIAPDRSNLNRARPRMNVLVESYRTYPKKSENDSSKKQNDEVRKIEEARKIAQFVAERLWWTRVRSKDAGIMLPYQTGVLPCVGFDDYRVVFLLPDNMEADLKDFDPQTLRGCIMTTARVSLETRFSLALQLAEAVFKVHLAGLAHRSIRSNFILFLRPKKDTSADGTSAAEDDTPRRGPQSSRNREEESPAAMTRRLTGHFSSRKKRPLPEQALRRNPSMTSMRKKRAGVLQRIGMRLGKGGSDDRDLDLLDKATADQEQDATPSPRRQLDSSPMTLRCGKIPPGFGSLYLTSWTSAHHCGSNHNPRSLRRTRDIYMHPALRRKTAFYMGHDIYSLGVCLVEVGMWDLFVRKESSADGATYGQLASLADVQSSGVDLETVKERIREFASQELPAAMGEGYAKLVNTCLTCLDPDGPWKYVGHEDFRERFRDDILLPLRSIVSGFGSWRLEKTAPVRRAPRSRNVGR